MTEASLAVGAKVSSSRLVVAVAVTWVAVNTYIWCTAYLLAALASGPFTVTPLQVVVRALGAAVFSVLLVSRSVRSPALTPGAVSWEAFRVSAIVVVADALFGATRTGVEGAAWTASVMVGFPVLSLLTRKIVIAGLPSALESTSSV